jgi:hypothetical protein
MIADDYTTGTGDGKRFSGRVNEAEKGWKINPKIRLPNVNKSEVI